jgi:hypothetical protein
MPFISWDSKTATGSSAPRRVVADEPLAGVGGRLELELLP